MSGKGSVGTGAPQDESMTGTNDPVTTEVIRYGLEAAADQMRTNLCRTAFSPAIYEISDFAAALYDREVRLLAQARSMPGFLGTLGFCLSSMLTRAGGAETLREGDVLFSTYGYDVGSHAADSVVVMPGFFEGELVGFAVIKAHNVDVGAKDPYCTDSTDIFQEGTIFPSVRLYSGGARNDDIYRTILANSRAPEALAGDLSAQIGSARVGLRELNRLFERFGRERFGGAVERIFDHSERFMRRFLQTIPDGQYSASGEMDDNGVDANPIQLKVVVDVAGDAISIDLSESADQQGGPVNSPVPTTYGMMRVAVITAAGINGSVNEGYFRPISVKTRPGSIFEPLPPAPVFLSGYAGVQAADLVHLALSDAAPGLVPAGNGGDICGFSVHGTDENGKFWITGGNHAVGMGASEKGDSTAPLMIMATSGVKSASAELHEAGGHVVVERVELAPDSGGAGRFRGGLGINATYRTRVPSRLVALTERTKTPPWGLHGGMPARANAVSLRLPDGTVQKFTKVTALELEPGTLFDLATGGGGGYGPPSERDPIAVRNDIREGYVSEDAARRDYPHAFDAENS